MARRVLNRRDLRAANDAAERRDEAEDQEEVAGSEAEAGDGEAKPKAKKKKAPAKPKAPKTTKPRKSRSTKSTRMRVLWGVFNNSHSMVKSFPYPQKADADALAKQLMADKKTTHFVNAVKEPIEEKKEE